jgi:hypothetical protein
MDRTVGMDYPPKNGKSDQNCCKYGCCRPIWLSGGSFGGTSRSAPRRGRCCHIAARSGHSSCNRVFLYRSAYPLLLDPSSATRPTTGHDCNKSTMAGLGAHGFRRRIHWSAQSVDAISCPFSFFVNPILVDNLCRASGSGERIS